jgi:hypothetical protein
MQNSKNIFKTSFESSTGLAKNLAEGGDNEIFSSGLCKSQHFKNVIYFSLKQQLSEVEGILNLNFFYALNSHDPSALPLDFKLLAPLYN